MENQRIPAGEFEMFDFADENEVVARFVMAEAPAQQIDGKSKPSTVTMMLRTGGFAIVSILISLLKQTGFVVHSA